MFERELPPRYDAVEGKLSAAVEKEFTDLIETYGDRVVGEEKVTRVEIDRAA